MTGTQALLAFAETVRQGSFAAAARELGLSPSAVAKSVARLEGDLGLRLLHRTTRQASLTSDGRGLYERCRRIVDELDALRSDAEGVRGEPSGTLRLNLPTTYGRKVVVPKLAALARRHPKLAFDVDFSDRHADLVRDGLDALVRIGPLRDSALVSRRIDAQALVVCASPRYLAERGVPERPADLDGHDRMIFRLPSSGRPRPWQFREGRRGVEIEPRGRVVFDDGDAMVSAALCGLGLMQGPDYIVEEELRRGRLVEVLAAYRPPALPISLVFAAARRHVPRLRVLVEMLVAR
jgi:DNA-binding transcriptional LysR family regulator